MHQDGCIEVVLVCVIDDTSHTLHILCVLFFDYVEDIVESDDSDQSVFIINYRYRDKTVFLKKFRSLFLVIIDVCEDDVLLS